MDAQEKQLAIDLIGLILNVGVPAAIKAMQQIELSHEPTVEEIRALSDKLKDPKSFFPCLKE